VTDTGPPYPLSPTSGSNAIGKFVIGVSPIGTIPLLDFWLTIISQYANSPILTQLIANMFAYIDQTANFDAFFDNIWDIDTAQGYGLDVWGRIVGVSRVLEVTQGEYLGFSQQIPGVDSFGPGGGSPFYSGEPSSSSFSLTDQAYRQLILAKAFYNICDGSVPAINQLLMTLFGASGQCYCTDGRNMTMTYTFQFQLNPVQSAIVFQSGVLPKPVGVSVTVVQIEG
jgi:hypothetical protein